VNTREEREESDGAACRGRDGAVRRRGAQDFTNISMPIPQREESAFAQIFRRSDD